MSYESKMLNGVESTEDDNVDVVVPLRLLRDLESARQYLYNMMEGIDDSTDMLIRLENISYPMYMLTHKKFPMVIE